jgi:serine phosphatase RsbU (regulator of sigma subunit)
MNADTLETRSCRQACTLRGLEGEAYVWRAIPLAVPGRPPIGVVTVCEMVSPDGPAARRERDLQLMGYLNQAARAIAAVGMRRQELAQAGHLQAGLLPGAPPRIDGWQIAAAWRPARETSGDFYDLIPLHDGQIGVVVADVADKGIGAALYMALSRTLIRTFAADYPGAPNRVLCAVSQRILAETEAGLFVTAFYGVLDPVEGTMTYCNAGHHPPYLMCGDPDSPVQALGGRGLALGVVEDASWGQSTIELQRGEALLLYTDGVVDAHNAEQERFGEERLVRIAGGSTGASAQGLVDNVLGRLQRFAGNEAQFDDITVVAIRREG